MRQIRAGDDGQSFPPGEFPQRGGKTPQLRFFRGAFGRGQQIVDGAITPDPKDLTMSQIAEVMKIYEAATF